jgi:hypothetical protein
VTRSITLERGLWCGGMVIAGAMIVLGVVGISIP